MKQAINFCNIGIASVLLMGSFLNLNAQKGTAFNVLKVGPDKPEKTRIKVDGDSHRIYSKFSDAAGEIKLQTILSEDDNYPYIIADSRSFPLTDQWQFFSYETKNGEDIGGPYDYVYIVSAFSGLNIQVPNNSKEVVIMELAKHKGNNRGNEIFAFVPVPGEEGWNYIINRNSNKYLRINRLTYVYEDPNINANPLSASFKMSPKHNTMVVRMQSGLAEMVFDNDHFEIYKDDRSFAVIPVAGKKDVYYITNSTYRVTPDNLYLSLNGKLAAGTGLVGKKSGNTPENSFLITKITDNLYKISPSSDPSLCVEVQNAGKGNKTPLVLGKYKGAPNQQFYFNLSPITYWNYLKQVDKSKLDDNCKFRVEDAGQVNWSGR